MNHYPMDMPAIEAVVSQIFPAHPVRIERMTEGVSTLVYRVIYQNEVFYLRILVENASFAPEVAVHTHLRQMQVGVPEVIYFEHYNELLQRSIMITAFSLTRSLSYAGRRSVYLTVVTDEP